jgi:hypothetical protein
MLNKNKEKGEVMDVKLQSAIRLLIEKLTYSGVELEGKSIIIKDGKLTIK